MATQQESLERAAYTAATTPNSTAIMDHAIFSRTISGTTYQVCGYWSSSQKLTLGIRTLPFGAWTLYHYDGTGGLANISLTTGDDHNAISVCIDADGLVHMAYAVHNSALHYRRSTAAVGSWTGALTAEQSFIGTNETSVTYPSFFVDPVGKLRVMIRSGIGGVGDYYMYQWNDTTDTWAAIGGSGTNGIILQNPGSPDISPYPFQLPVFTSDWDGAGTGYMYMAWTPRQLGLMGENVYVLRWDGLTTWSKIGGSTQTMPATSANSDNVHTTSTTVGLLNTSGMCLDANNRPVISIIKSDGTRHQLWALYYTGSAWSITQVSSFSAANTYTDYGRPYVVCDTASNIVYMIWAHASLTGVQQSASDPGDFSTWTTTTFWNAVVGNGEPRLDPAAWVREGELCMFIARGRNISSGTETIRIVQRAPKAVSLDYTETRKHAITIDHTKVGSGGTSNFTILLTRANFDNEVCDPSGSYKAQADGGDLRFYSDSSLTTQLACHVVRFGHDSSSGAGDATCEVRVGPLTLSSSTDTTIYVAYHAASGTKHQPFIDETYGAKAAYDASWKHAFPMTRSKLDLLTLDEYTLRLFAGAPAHGTGKIGNGVDFNGAEGFTFGTRQLGIGSAFSLFGWVSVDTTLSDFGFMFGADDNSGNRALQFRVDQSTGKVTLIRFNSSNSVTTNITGTSDLRNAGFKRVAAIWDTTSGAAIYINATSEASDANLTAQHDDTALEWTVGYNRTATPANRYFLQAILDQFEVHTTRRNAAWITTDFNNGNSPASFSAAGTPRDTTITGTGALVAASATSAGDGARAVVAAGDIVVASAGIDGSGSVVAGSDPFTGTGALVSQASSMSGVAVRGVTGTGALIAQVAAISGGVDTVQPLAVLRRSRYQISRRARHNVQD